MEYTYHALEDATTYIRLLYLLPPHPSFPDKLVGCLLSFPRAAAPAYEPLSYTWGAQEPTSEILLRPEPTVAMLLSPPPQQPPPPPRRMPIRPNLEGALRALRPASGEIGVFLWVDALCINQGDHAEKAQQVRNMDQVYRGRHVRIWLGEPSADSDLALDLLDAMRQSLGLGDDDHDLGGHGDAAGLTDFINAEVAAATSAQERGRSRRWQAVSELFGRGWFTRRWIVQETVLSTHKRVHIGHRAFNWEYLVLAARFLKSTPSLRGLQQGGGDLQPQVGAQIWHQVPATMDRVESVLRLSSASLDMTSQDLTLGRLLESFVGYFSQDPRDGIYAFLSMASDIEPGSWLPDYSSDNPAEHVYRRAAYHLIAQSGGRTDFLCRTHPRVSKRLLGTSWLPVFGPHVLRLEEPPGQQQHEHVVYGYSVDSLVTFGQPSWQCPNGVYAACPPEANRVTLPPEAEWGLTSTSRHLRLSGVHVATLARVGPPSQTVGAGGDAIEIRLPEEWYDMMGVPGRDVESVPDEFFRAITGDRVVGESGPKRPGEDWVERVRNTFREAGALNASHRQVVSSVTVMLSNHRCFAQTDDASPSMAFVPHFSEAGDMVFILAGCSVPVVLKKRAADDAYELVGEAYVQGWMEGDIANRDDVTWQSVLIY